ncbi:MAG: hypothetical protein M3Y72_06910 [Acidobacteriota bacterium]|nr:hypothetical protein [Acidobacteriota bacterium]
MALARQSMPTLQLGPVRSAKRRRLVVSAAVLSGLSCLAAFIVLVLRDQNHANVMVNEQKSPTLSHVSAASSLASTKTSSLGPGQPISKPSGLNDSLPGNRFSLAKLAAPTTLGSVKLKLIKTDPALRLYDVSATVGGHSFSHRRLKAGEPLWISENRGGTALELVVSSIQSDSVMGYWTESSHLAHVSPRNHLRRR